MRILSAKNTGPIGWKQGNNTMNSENMGGGGVGLVGGSLFLYFTSNHDKNNHKL